MIWLVLLILNQCTALNELPKLIVVSFDGFRNSYVDLNFTPELVHLREMGTSTPYMINVFPTQTFPNHFSIATGLYPEVHGVLGSQIYDPLTKKVLNYSSLWSHNHHIVPLWTLNEKAGKGRHSGTMMWPGGEFPFDRVNTTFTKPWDMKLPWEKRIDEVITWMTHRVTPANVAFLYFEEPDLLSHIFGPASGSVREEISLVDSIVKYLFSRLKAARLLGGTNVVLLSDHGFAGVYLKNVINLKSICGKDCEMYGTSPVRQILPKTDVNSVYNKLNRVAKEKKTFSVYKKADIPERWNFKNCNLTLPILAVAEVGYAFEDLFEYVEEYKQLYSNVSDTQLFGVHGYDPGEPLMRPFFIAVGPAFKTNHTVKPFRNIDLYALFAHVLDLRLPDLKPNSSLANVKDILKDTSLSTKSFLIVLSISLALLTVVGFLFCIARYMEFLARKRSWEPFENTNDLNSLVEQEALISCGSKEDLPVS